MSAYGPGDRPPAARRRPRPKPKPKPRPAPPPPTKQQISNSRRQAAGYASQGQQVERTANRQRKAAQKRARRTFQPVPSLQPFPGKRTADREGRNAERAERRSRGGSIPLPALPAIRYTPKQRQAALTLVRRSVAEAKRRGETQASIDRARRFDPRVRSTLNRAIGLQRGQIDELARRQAAQTAGSRRVTSFSPLPGMLRPDGTVRIPGLTGLSRRQRTEIGRELLAQNRAQAKPGREHSRVGVGPASVDLTAAKRGVLDNLKSGHGVAGIEFVKSGGEIVGNAAEDAAFLVPNMARGIYEIGAAGVELTAPVLARRGKPKGERAEKILRSMDDGALGQLAQGNVDEALKQLKEHPLYSLLDFTGAYAALGRTAGAGARVGLAGRRAKGYARDRNRGALRDDATGAEVPRAYSRNLFTMGAQKRRDARTRAKGGNPNVLRDNALRDVAHAVTLGAVRPGLGGTLRKRADEFAAQREGVRREGREQLRKDLLASVPVRRGRLPGDATLAGGRSVRLSVAGAQAARRRAAGAVDRAAGRPRVTVAGRSVATRPERHVVTLAVENIVDTRSRSAFVHSLADELDRLEDVAKTGKLRGTAKAENLEQQRLIGAVLRDDKALDNFAEVGRAAERFKSMELPRREGLIRRGVLDEQQAQHAAERPFAVTQMGATYRHSTEPPTHLVERWATAKARASEAKQEVRLARQRQEAAVGAAARDRKAADRTPAPKLGPQGAVYNRLDVRQRIDELGAEHYQVLERYNELSRALERRREAEGTGRHLAPLVDRLTEVWGQANGLHNRIEALKEAEGEIRRGERVTGAPDKRVDEVTWYHGTPARFEGLPTAKGSWNDLGVYATSDPGYAAGYARTASGEAAEGQRIVMGRVDVPPERVLDMRAGTANPHEIGTVLDKVLELAERVTTSRKAARIWAEGSTAKGWGTLGIPDRPTSALTPGLRTQLTNARDTLWGGGKLTLEEWRAMDGGLRQASSEIAQYIGKSGTGRMHRPLNRLLRGMGYDVLRKVDQYADSIVVVNERMLKSPYHARNVAEAKAARSAARVPEARAARRDAERIAKQLAREAAGVKPKRGKGLVADGELLSLDAIQASRAARGLPEPGFVTHQRSSRGAKSYFVNWWDRRAGVGSDVRTGESARTGARAIDEQALHDSLIRQQGILDAVDGFDDYVRMAGRKRADGRMFKPAEAEARADLLRTEHGVDMVPLRVAPAKLSKEALEEIERAQDAGRMPQMDTIVDDQWGQATEIHAGGNKARNVVLVPREEVLRFMDHQKLLSGPGGRAMQKLTGIFRGTVLSTSTKWLFGNAAEATIRSLVSQGPMFAVNVYAGARAMRALRAADDFAYRQMNVRTRGGLLYGSGERLGVHRDASALRGTDVEAVGAGIGAAMRAPLVRQTLAGIAGYQRGVFAANKFLERQFQNGVIGKAVRDDMLDLNASWGRSIKLSGPAFEDAVNGLRNTQNQIRYAQAVDDTLGKYTRFGPQMRRVTQTLMPFLPWYLNSVRFVTHTLPVKHPVTTALLVHVEEAFRQDWDKEPDVPPGDLEYAIRLGNGGMLPLARYTPFGAFTDLPAGVLDPVLPQLSSVAKMLDNPGRDWTGRPLHLQGRKPGEVSGGERLGLAAYALLESLVPGIAIARRMQEHGETAWSDSTVFAPKTKPGTAYNADGSDSPGLGAAAERVFNPLRPTYLRKPAGATGAGAGRPLTRAEKRERDLLLEEARQEARSGGATLSKRERELLLREARLARRP